MTLPPDAVEQFCAILADWTHRDCGLVGLPARTVQCDIIDTLYRSLLAQHADGASLRALQQQKLALISETESSYANMPDLFEQHSNWQVYQ